jgi:hypothetical protein
MSTTLDITDLVIESDVTVVEISNALPLLDSDFIEIQPYGSITATTIQGAIEQLADQNFRSTTTPTGSNVEEGDTWYDTDDNQLKVYRETSAGVFEWVPIIIGNISPDSDTLDAGAF